MALSSLTFLLGFLPIVVIGAHLLRDNVSARAAQVWILAASLVFYAASGITYVPLLLFSAGLNWAVGRGFALLTPGAVGRKRLLVFGLSANIVLLCVVKYTGFFFSILGHWVRGLPAPPHWMFPLGVSFFTLSQIMYLVDCYEKLTPANTALDHFTFVSFFPNITAGPLERVKHFVQQLPSVASPAGRDERLERGIALLVMGLFKKAVIADSFARVANAGYGHLGTMSTAGAWLTSLAYTFQMYFDFSGYSDMAFGAGRLLGISLTYNFNAPYRSLTIAEYWQRWHISLSQFIATYLYTPILRRMGRANVHKAAFASVLSMTIAGFWHGPAWTFVLWGMLHGTGIAVYQYWKRLRRPLPRLAANALTFAFVNLTLVLFRAPTVLDALRVSRLLLPSARMFGVADILSSIPDAFRSAIVLPIAFGLVAAFAGPTSTEIAERFRPSLRAAVGVAAVACAAVAFVMAGTGSAFLYRAF